MSLALLISAAVLALHGTAIWLAARAIAGARTPQGAVGWTVFLLVLPYLAVPAYLVFGDFRYPERLRARQLSEIAARGGARPAAPGPAGDGLVAGFEAIAGQAVTEGAAARLLIDGAAFFDALFAEIARAERYILIETYILRDDSLGRDLAGALIARARAGVRVAVLYDPFGSYGLGRAYLAELRAAGVEIVNFHARHGGRLGALPRVNFRNHRKIAVIDGRVGFTGGANFGAEYLGPTPRFGAWRDTMVRLAGPVVAQLQLAFAEDWHWATGAPLALDWAPEPAGTARALVLASGPSDPRESGGLYFAQAITAARARVWIASPYFAPDPGLMQALRLAALRGVDVRVIVAGRRDHWLVWLAGFAFLEEMRGAGVRFYRYGPGFMHQKVVLVDEAMAAIGSHNLDSRSCRLNFEASALIFDEGFAREVGAMLEADFAAAGPWERPMKKAPLALRLAAPFARLFAPIL